MSVQWATIRCHKDNGERLATAIRKADTGQILQVHPCKETFADEDDWKAHWNERYNDLYYSFNSKDQERAHRTSKALEKSNTKKENMLKAIQTKWENESYITQVVRRLYDQLTLPNTICSKGYVSRREPLLYGLVGSTILPIYFNRTSGLIKTGCYGGDNANLTELPTQFYKITYTRVLEAVQVDNSEPLQGQRRIILWNFSELANSYDSVWHPHTIKKTLETSGFHVKIVHAQSYDYRVRDLVFRKFMEDGSVYEVITYKRYQKLVANKKFMKFNPYEIEPWLKKNS